MPAAGFPLTLLPGRGIQRRLTFANVGAVVGACCAGWSAGIALVRRLPAGGRGGHRRLRQRACVPSPPCCWRVPLVVAEQNAVPGAANRLIGPVRQGGGGLVPGHALPRAVVTGNPVRPEVVAAAAATATAPGATLGVAPDRTSCWCSADRSVRCGSTRRSLAAVERWRDRADLAVRHVVGRRDWEPIIAADARCSTGPGSCTRPSRTRTTWPRAGGGRPGGVPRRLEHVLRAGRGRRCRRSWCRLRIVTGDHQTANARAVAEAGGRGRRARRRARRRPAGGGGRRACSPTRRGWRRCRRRSRGCARLDAADRVAALAEEHARDCPSRRGSRGHRPLDPAPSPHRRRRRRGHERHRHRARRHGPPRVAAAT